MRMVIWQQAAVAAIILAYLLFMSAVGGAPLARYLLPITPVVILLSVATLWRRLRYWALIIGAVAVAFVAGLFSNPPYGFSVEDNLAYRDFVVMHSEASRFLAMRYPNATVLTAWPAPTSSLARGSVMLRVPLASCESKILLLRKSTWHLRPETILTWRSCSPPSISQPHELLANWAAWQRIKERFFGFHRDLLPEEIARRLGGRIAFHKEENGLWVAVIALDKERDAQLRLPADYPPSR